MAAWSAPAFARLGLPTCSLQNMTPTLRTTSTMAAENSAHPCRWLPANLPNMYVNATGIARIASISMRLVSGVGFSNGCAELALK